MVFKTPLLNNDAPSSYVAFLNSLSTANENLSKRKPPFLFFNIDQNCSPV